MKDIKCFVLGLATIIACMILVPISILYSLFTRPRKFADYIFNVCKGVDLFGCVACADLFNDALIKSPGHKFGFAGEYISSVLGKNEVSKTQRPVGTKIDKWLSIIQKNHCVDSIATDIKIPD